jgi:WD40 repeat protein
MTQQNLTSDLQPTLQRFSTTTRSSRRFTLILAFVLIAALGLVWKLYQKRHSGLSPTRFVQAQGLTDVVTYSEDGQWLLTGGHSSSDTITIWNSQSMRAVHQWRGGGDKIRISENGKLVLTEDYNSTSRGTRYALRDATGRLKRQWATKHKLLDIARDFSLLLTSDGTKNVYLQETATGKIRGQFTSIGVGGYGTRFLRNALYIGVPGNKGRAQLLRTSDLRPVLALPPLQEVRLSRDGQRVLGLDANKLLHIWQLPSRRHKTQPIALKFIHYFYELEDGSLVFVGSLPKEKDNVSEPIVQVRSVDGTRILHSFSDLPRAFSSKGNLVAYEILNKDKRGVFRNDTKSYEVFDVRSGNRITRVNIQSDALGQPVAWSGFFNEKFVIAPHGKQFIFATNDGLLRVYEPSAQETQTSAKVSTTRGRRIGSSQENASTPVTVPYGGVVPIDMTHQQCVDYLFTATLLSEEKTKDGLQFTLTTGVRSFDGKRVLAVWTGTVLGEYKEHSVVESTNDGLLEIRDTENGRLLRTLEFRKHLSVGMSSLGHPTWSPDGKFIAIPNETGQVFLWNTFTGTQEGQLSNTRTQIHGIFSSFAAPSFLRSSCLAFTPDNRFLAVGRDDGSIYVYSLKSFLPVAQIGKAPAQLRWMQFTPNGRTLHGFTEADNVLTWDMPNL